MPSGQALNHYCFPAGSLQNSDCFPFMRYMIVWNSDDFTGIHVRNDMSIPLPFDPMSNFLLPTTKEYAKKPSSSLSQEKGGILGKFSLSSGSKKHKILTSFTI